jgi:endogenous inhibitor of DNA gyrase (YacG/DUF329 family)
LKQPNQTRVCARCGRYIDPGEQKPYTNMGSLVRCKDIEGCKAWVKARKQQDDT